MIAKNPDGYWFLAHRYGYGWGRPASWQGLLILLTVPLVLVVGAYLPENRLWLMLPMLLVSTGLLVWGCVRHGEPARWRWGKKSP